jgi:hypothetical protein
MPRYPRQRSSSFVVTTVATALMIVALILVIILRVQTGHLIVRTAHTISGWFAHWVPAHPQQAWVIGAFGLAYLVINFIAHLVGRWRALLSVFILETWAWFDFWYNVPYILKTHLFKLNSLHNMPAGRTFLSWFWLMLLPLILFLFWEWREVWKHREHSLSEGD